MDGGGLPAGGHPGRTRRWGTHRRRRRPAASRRRRSRRCRPPRRRHRARAPRSAARWRGGVVDEAASAGTSPRRSSPRRRAAVRGTAVAATPPSATATRPLDAASSAGRDSATTPRPRGDTRPASSRLRRRFGTTLTTSSCIHDRSAGHAVDRRRGTRDPAVSGALRALGPVSGRRCRRPPAGSCAAPPTRCSRRWARWPGPRCRRAATGGADLRRRPRPRGHPGVLDALAAAGAHATFFVLGDRAARHPDLVRRVVGRGPRDRPPRPRPPAPHDPPGRRRSPSVWPGPDTDARAHRRHRGALVPPTVRVAERAHVRRGAPGRD